MALEKYTNTYTDINTNIFDSDDLVAEFGRVATFLNSWSQSINKIGTVTVVEERITILDTIFNVDPADGLLQSLKIADDVSNLSVIFDERTEEGDTYRVYLSLRFQNKSTTFTVNGPAGQTHLFGVNKISYLPSQVVADGFYTALVIATYGTSGLLVNVFADNDEITAVSSDDILSTVAI